MTVLQKIKETLGFDIKKDEYAFGRDPQYGYLSQKKIPERWVKTTCGYCSVGCGMVVGVKGGEIVSVRGDEEHPVNEGSLCPKGLSEHLPLKSPNRAHAPLWHGKPISWERAYEEMVGRVRRIQEQDGKESFAVLSTGQLVTEEFYALGKLVQLGFGTSNYDGNTTLCMSSAVAGYKQSFGSDGPPGSYRGLREADTVFLIGANIADNHPILWHHLNQNEDYKLIVCDPRKTKTAMFADLYLPIRPRGDVYLLNGLINLVIKHGYVDQDFVDAHTIGFEALAEHASHYPIEVVSEHTGFEHRSDLGGLPSHRQGRECPLRVDHGRQSLDARDGYRQLDQHPRADYRQYRSHRCCAVVHHRPMQRYGHPRVWLCLIAAGLPQI